MRRKENRQTWDLYLEADDLVSAVGYWPTSGWSTSGRGMASPSEEDHESIRIISLTVARFGSFPTIAAPNNTPSTSAKAQEPSTPNPSPFPHSASFQHFCGDSLTHLNITEELIPVPELAKKLTAGRLPALRVSALSVQLEQFDRLLKCLRTGCRALQALRLILTPVPEDIPCIHELVIGEDATSLDTFEVNASVKDDLYPAGFFGGSDLSPRQNSMSPACQYECYKPLMHRSYLHSPRIHSIAAKPSHVR